MSEQNKERKVRRVRRSRSGNSVPIKVTPATSKRPSRMVEVTEDDLRTEYAYVLKDLRLLLIIAIGLFVLLFALNLAFPYVAPLLGLS
ncbi:MAG: hypothetical protein KDD89_06365 [Anaerolineales bacterium]|nr:hypothetical protein [Anaerolineales bacterium]